MFGLTVIVFFVFYLAVSIGVTIFAVRWAKNRGRRPWLWGGVAALLMYNLVFWDYLPTLITFKYLVHTKSGFWVYKTPEQWKEENPGVAETLIGKPISETIQKEDGTFVFMLNKKFFWETRREYLPIIPVSVATDLITEVGTNKVMAKRVKIGTRTCRGFLISMIECKWLESYVPNVKEFSDLKKDFKYIGEKTK